jgi:HAD superfamily hydrolase (TIGR01450 family)
MITAEQKELLKSMKLFLFDMDGTLYLGNRLYDFTIELLDTIKANGGKYLFMTNNSSKSVVDYIKKLHNLGIEATREDFMTSSQATAFYLHKYHEGQTLYVCGTESLKEELRMEGFTVTTDLDKVECIVMGFDTELTFQKLHDVSYLLLTRPELPYIATNPDLVCPTAYGYVPDCGSIAQALEHATGRLPVMMGKPRPAMVQLAMKAAGATPEQTVLLGDRVYTDIAAGVNAGIDTVLVLSGEGTRADADASQQKPTWILDNIRTVYEIIK